MKKIALIAFVAISFTTFSCKENASQPEPSAPTEDSLNIEQTEVPAQTADSVESVTVDSAKTDSVTK